MVGLYGLKGLLQIKWFYDSILKQCWNPYWPLGYTTSGWSPSGLYATDYNLLILAVQSPLLSTYLVHASSTCAGGFCERKHQTLNNIHSSSLIHQDSNLTLVSFNSTSFSVPFLYGTVQYCELNKTLRDQYLCVQRFLIEQKSKIAIKFSKDDAKGLFLIFTFKKNMS